MNKLHQHEHLANKDKKKKKERNFWFYMIAYILKGQSIFFLYRWDYKHNQIFFPILLLFQCLQISDFSHVQREDWDEHSNALILLSVNYFRVVFVIHYLVGISTSWMLPIFYQTILDLKKKKSWYWLAFDKLIKTFGSQDMTASVFFR